MFAGRDGHTADAEHQGQQWRYICEFPYVNSFVMHTGSPHMQCFCLPPRMHMVSSRLHTVTRFWHASNLSLSHTLNQNFLSAHAHVIKHHPHMLYGDDTDHCLHTGIAIHIIPVCIQGFSSNPICIRGSRRSSFGYGDCMTHNPCIHMGICAMPICIWGLFNHYPYAYGKYFHIGNQVLYPHMHNFPHRDCHMQRRIPVCIQVGSAKKFAYGDPPMHNETVRIWGLIHIRRIWPPSRLV
jgi:hypothetical protein